MKKISVLIVFCFLALQAAFSQSAFIKEAKMQLENENFSSARNTLNKYIATNPKDIGEAYYYLGESYYLDEKVDSARTIWTKGVSLDNRSTYSRIGTGKLLLDENKPGEASKEFALAARYSKEAADINSLIARSYLNSKNPKPDQAVTFASKARDGNPKEAAYLVLLGDANDAQKESGKAMSSYELASDKDKNNAEVYVKMARIWGRTTQQDQAIAKLEEAISKFPNYAPAYKDLIELYVRQQKSSKVTPLLEKYVKLAGTDLDARKRYVKYLTFQAKAYDKAIEEGNRVLQEDPKAYSMNRWLGWSYVEKEQYAEGFDALTKYFAGLDTIQASIADYNYFAKAAAKTEKIDVAINTYNKVLQLDSTKTDIYELIAKMYFDGKMYPEAAAAYEQKIAKLGPKSADYVSLGRAYNLTKEYVKADSAFAKVNELSPTYVYGYYARAQSANGIDSTQEKYLAKPYYEKLIELSATDPKFQTETSYKRYLVEALNYMGVYTYATTSNAPQAIALLDRALAIDPTNEYSLNYKDQITKAAAANGKGNK